jgi:S1-C subfamily serine protease
MRNRSVMAAIFLLLTIGRFGITAAEGETARFRGAVVKVEAVHQRPNYVDPWKMNLQRTVTGSGCVIEGRRILTNAHVVSHAKYLQVQKAGDITKYTAEIAFVADDCDLALLSVKDPDFFSGVTPVEIGGIPREGEKVTVYGFPVGGNKISLTEGVVSRIEMNEYAHSQRTFLTVQIDAAINPGNSGGPVMKQDRLVGVAFEALKESENTGYIIPVPVINRFLADVRDGSYDGFPDLGCQVQNLENEAMRRAFKASDKQTGVYVCSVEYGSSSWGTLREGDLLLSIDNVTIAKDGTVPFGGDERIDFSYLLTRYQIGDPIDISFSRNGERGKAKIVLKAYDPLVPRIRWESNPAYYIFAGLVLVPENVNYLLANSNKENCGPAELENYLEHGRKSLERREVVVLLKVLAHDINRGFQELGSKVVDSINGVRPAGMREAIQAFRNPRGTFHVIRLETGEKIVFDAAAADEATGEILQRYQIPADRSPDLKGKGENTPTAGQKRPENG